MFGIDTGELMVIALVALVVIGPKDLPRVMRTVGRWVGQARGMARHFRSGFDAMIRESELEDMEKKWREDNERIMRMHPPKPPSSGDSDWGKAEQVPAAVVLSQVMPMVFGLMSPLLALAFVLAVALPARPLRTTAYVKETV